MFGMDWINQRGDKQNKIKKAVGELWINDVPKTN
jgi:hypothetical protein